MNAMSTLGLCCWCSFLAFSHGWTEEGSTKDGEYIVEEPNVEVRDKHKGCGRRLVLGVDYYAEHWPHSSMHTDLHAIKHDLGADIIRIGDFMWHELEPKNGTFNFTLLDELIDSAAKIGLEVMLATPTAGAPAWLYHNYPSVFQRGPDSADGFVGAQPSFGGRRLYSFNSEIFLFHAKRVADKLARRYGQHPAVTFWQVDNELGHEGSDLDFSENSLHAWHLWLQKKYDLDIRSLNDAWGTVFWSATYNTFEEVPLPHWTIPGNVLQGNENFRSNLSPGMLLDFRRFRRDSVTQFALEQVHVLRAGGIHGCVTTNAPGGFWGKAMDHAQLFEGMDMPAYDNYPVWGGSTEAPLPATVALVLSTVRRWATSPAKGWMIAEQLIGAQGHDIIGYNPRPGQAMAWASAALLHGATALLFFRYRAAVFGQEQFCYGILDHTTPVGAGRKWKEVKDFYSLARQHKSIWSAPTTARVAVVYDVENIFAWQDFLRYEVLLLPAPMLTSDALVQHLAAFVEAGKSLWVGFRADLKDERSQIRRSRSRLAAMAGVEVVEIESLGDSSVCNVASADGRQRATCGVWREGLATIPGMNSEVVWRYAADAGTNETFYQDAGFAAVARRKTAKSGEAIYVGAGIETDALLGLAEQTLSLQKIDYMPVSKSKWLEQQMRHDVDGKPWQIYINHGSKELELGETVLPAYAVLITNVTIPSHAATVHRRLSFAFSFGAAIFLTLWLVS